MASGTKINIDLVLNTKGFRPLGRINGQLGEFEKSLDASNARVLAFGASAGAILAVKKAFTATVSSMIEVEKALTDINVILNTSTTNLKKFGSDLFTVASQTGQSFKVAAEAALELSRQGLGLEETMKRTRDALVLARLSGMGAAEAVQSLTAALNTFNQVGLDSTLIINKLANVDAAFAVSSDDLAKALGRVGASAKGAGVSLDELLAIVTTAQQKTARGGAVIGNSFKTIFTRIQRPRVLGQLEELGVRVRDLEGSTLPALKVLQNLARQFDVLTQAQQAQITELVGGVFQVNILKAAMSDLSSEQSIYNKALKISAGSTDEAIQRNARLNETLSAQFNRTVNSFKEGAAELGNLTLEPALRNLLNVGDAIADASKSESGVAKAGQFIGKSLFTAIGKFIGGPGLLIIGFTLFRTFKQLGTFAADAFKTLTGLNKNFQNQLSLQKQIFDVLSENPDLMNKIKNGTITIEDAHKEIFDQIEKNTGALDRQLLVSKQLSESLTAGGVGISPEFGATKGKKPRKFGSHGFIPSFARDPEEILGMAQGGYSRSQLRNARTRKERLYDGRGGSQMATVNGYESVLTGRNRGGSKATFVVPPKGTDAHKKYMSSLSGKAGGFIPNFNKALLEKLKSMVANPSLRTGKGAVGRGGDPFTREAKADIMAGARSLYSSSTGEEMSAKVNSPSAAIKLAEGAYARTQDPDYAEQGGGRALYGSKGDVGKWRDHKDNQALVLDAKGKYGVLGLYGGNTDKGFAYADPSAITNLSGKTQVPDLRNRLLHGNKKVGIANLQFRSLASALKDKKADWASQSSTKFTQKIRQHFASPTTDLAKDVVKDFKLRGKAKVRPSDIGGIKGSGGRLFSVSAEGEIFEVIANAISKGAGAGGSFEKALKGSSQQTWDFPRTEKGFKDVYGFNENLKMADAKRSMSPEALGTVVNKVFSTGKGKDAEFLWDELPKWKSAKKKSGGYIPNFNALYEAVRRESDAGVSNGKIRVGKNGSLVSSGNPLGLGVYNTDDEPRGLGQGINRERRQGRNPRRSGASSGYVPNYKASGGMLADPMVKLGASIFAVQTVFSTLETALAKNTAAQYLARETGNLVVTTMTALIGADFALKKVTEKLAKKRKKQEDIAAGRDPEAETPGMMDMFSREKWAKGVEDFGRGRRQARARIASRSGVGGRRGLGFGGRIMATATGTAAGKGMAGIAGGIKGMAKGGTIGLAIGSIAALGLAARFGTKTLDNVFQTFKIRDAEAAAKSFQAIQQRNQKVAAELDKYSQALKSFTAVLDKGNSSVQGVMNGLHQLQNAMADLSPEVRKQFTGVFDPRSAGTLIEREQSRMAGQTARAQNRQSLTQIAAELGPKEGYWDDFKENITFGMGGQRIDERSTDLQFKNVADSILTGDENVSFSKALAAAEERRPGAAGDIIETLSSGDNEKVIALFKELGFGEETIASFSATLERAGGASSRFKEALANNAIATHEANVEMKFFKEITEKMAKDVNKQRKAIIDAQRELAQERKVRAAVGDVMMKGADLFLTEAGKIDLKTQTQVQRLQGDRSEKLAGAGVQFSKALGNQVIVNDLATALGKTMPALGEDATKEEKEKRRDDTRLAARDMLGRFSDASTSLRSRDMTIAGQGKAELDTLNKEITDLGTGEANKNIIASLNKIQDSSTELLNKNEEQNRSLKNQTELLTKVADAEKELIEIQRQIASFGGADLGGLGGQVKKIAELEMAAELAGGADTVGGRRLLMQRDIVQQKMLGKDEFNRLGLTTGARANAQKSIAETMMAIPGRFRPGIDANNQTGHPARVRWEESAERKAGSLFGGTPGKDPSSDVRAAMGFSEETLANTLQQVEKINDLSIKKEQLVVSQIEALVELQTEYREGMDKWTEAVKEITKVQQEHSDRAGIEFYDRHITDTSNMRTGIDKANDAVAERGVLVQLDLHPRLLAILAKGGLNKSDIQLIQREFSQIKADQGRQLITFVEGKEAQ